MPAVIRVAVRAAGFAVTHTAAAAHAFFWIQVSIVEVLAGGGGGLGCFIEADGVRGGVSGGEEAEALEEGVY